MAAMEGLLHHMMPVLIQEQAQKDRGWYGSHVLDFREGEEIVVDVPMERGYDVPIEQGARIRVQTSHPDGIRRFGAAVLRRRDVPAPCLYLSWPDEIERIQRREYVRIEVAARIAVRLVGADGEEPRVFVGYTADLSAGGLKIDVSEPLAPASIAEVQLELPGHGTLICKARILRAGQSESPGGGVRHWVAVQFDGISESNRNDLKRFVSDVQQEQIRQGLR